VEPSVSDYWPLRKFNHLAKQLFQVSAIVIYVQSSRIFKYHKQTKHIDPPQCLVTQQYLPIFYMHIMGIIACLFQLGPKDLSDLPVLRSLDPSSDVLLQRDGRLRSSQVAHSASTEEAANPFLNGQSRSNNLELKSLQV